MRITYRRNKRLLLVLAFELVALSSLVMLLGHMSEPAASGDFNLTVYGYVKDSAGRPLEDANVTVKVLSTSATQWCDTDSLGWYVVEFGMADWDVDDTIQVVAMYHGNQETNTTTASELGTEQCDINYAFEIPEFGTSLGTLVSIVAVAAVALLFFWKRPR